MKSPTRAGQIRNSAKAIIRRGDQLLVVVMRDRQGPWYICPGGGQDHGESLIDALQRECLEEIGCTLKVGHLCFIREYIADHHTPHEGTEGLHQLDFFFHAELRNDGDPLSHQADDPYQTAVAWKSISELKTLRFFPQALLAALEKESHGLTYLGDVN